MKKASNPNHGWQTGGKYQHTVQRLGKSPGPCGTCIHFPICSKISVKNAQADTEYCLWGTDSNLYEEKNENRP